MTVRTDLLNQLFTNADNIIGNLSAESGEFDSQRFLRHLMKDQQKAYIEFLAYHKEGSNPFTSAHQEIGQELRRRAERCGYVMQPDLIEVESLFLTRTTATVYRKVR